MNQTTSTKLPIATKKEYKPAKATKNMKSVPRSCSSAISAVSGSSPPREEMRNTRMPLLLLPPPGPPKAAPPCEIIKFLAISWGSEIFYAFHFKGNLTGMVFSFYIIIIYSVMITKYQFINKYIKKNTMTW